MSSKLAFEKTTIRSLTDAEIGDVAGGTTPTSFYYSSSPCAQAAAAAAIAAYEAYKRYA